MVVSVLDKLPPTAELVKHYKSRVETFEAERNELLNKIDECKLQHQEKQMMSRELLKREGEVIHLQKALGEAHGCLFEERERYLELQRENDNLRIQEKEDRKKIAHLLSLCQPVNQEVTYARNTMPELVHFSQAEGDGDSDGDDQSPSEALHLTSHHSDVLLMKIESLQKQLNEHKKFASERIASLLEDRRLREQDEDVRRVQVDNERHRLHGKLKNTEELLHRTTKDALVMRQEKQQAETRAAEAESGLNVAHKSLVGKYERKQRKLEQNLMKKHEEKLHMYKEKLEENETAMANMEAAHGALKTNYERRIMELESALEQLKKKHKQLEYRRALDLTGFNSDISQLRKQIVCIDRKLHGMRLIERLEDHDKVDHLLQHLELKSPSLNRSSNFSSGSKGRKGSHRKTKSGRVAEYTDVPGTADILGDIDKVRGELQTVAENLLNVMPSEA